MSLETISDLDRTVASDQSLRMKLESAGSPDELAAIVRDAGFAFTQQDVDDYVTKVTEELSDDDLDAIAGGAALSTRSQNISSDHAFAAALVRLGRNKVLDSCWVVRSG